MALRYAGLGIGLGLLVGLLAPPALSSALGLAPSLTQREAQPLAQAGNLDSLPDNKTLTLVVEGEPQEVSLQLYQRPDRPLVTYYPTGMTVHDFCDSDGCGVSFVDEAMGTALLFIFPATARQATEVEPHVAEVFTDNAWIPTGESTEAPQTRFDWAQKMITFEAPEDEALGITYLGELAGQGFAAIMLFAPDAGDGFVPLANAVLSEVRVQE